MQNEKVDDKVILWGEMKGKEGIDQNKRTFHWRQNGGNPDSAGPFPYPVTNKLKRQVKWKDVT